MTATDMITDNTVTSAKITRVAKGSVTNGGDGAPSLYRGDNTYVLTTDSTQAMGDKMGCGSSFWKYICN